MDDADRKLVQRLRSQRLADEAQSFVDVLAQHPALWPLNKDTRERLHAARRAIDNMLIESRRRQGEGVMRGDNVITINEQTLREMIESYFHNSMFRLGEAPRVVRVNPRWVGGDPPEIVFDVTTDGPRDTEDSSD